MLRKGFTLIELLIVITIIAILAGAAIPYVQDYVEDSRLAKARADLDEVKNALIRYELDTGKLWTEEAITNLVGPYLAKAITDPWGQPYEIDPTSSVAFSYGPDRKTGAVGTPEIADNIYVDFRPPQALSRVYWIDANKDGVVNTADQLKIRFTRAPAVAGVTGANLLIENTTALTLSSQTPGTDQRDYILTLGVIPDGLFTPGRDRINPTSAITDLSTQPTANNPSKANLTIIKSL